MKKILLVIIILTGVVIWYFIFSRLPAPPVSNLELFAKCLAEKNATMYGAVWCSHCQNQKNLFGDSFKFVKYVECPDNPKVCLDAGVNGYPTWIFSNGNKLEGEQSLEILSEKSSCQLQPLD